MNPAHESRASDKTKARRFGNVFRALRFRNYRLFFGGQLISLIGTWMQQIALTWLVYRLTNSAFLLGLVGFAGQLPMFLLGPLAGVIADRFNKQRIVIITQTLSMIQAGILAVLTLTGTIAVWHIMVLSVFLGLINAFDMPTRQSFLLEMIENKDELGNAIALNSSMFNGARLVGPAIAGLVIAAIGEGLCFFLNAVSYIAVIIALLAMKLPPRHHHQKKSRGMMVEFKEGFRYVIGFSTIRNILLLIALVSLAGMPYTVLMPIFAKDILQGGAHTLGFLMGAVGVGALSGALILASRKNIIGLSRWIPFSATVFGAGIIGFSFSRALPLSLVLLFIAGLGMMVQIASSNTIMQTIADDDKRGRVMSFYTMSFVGMTPFGSLLAGSLASSIGAPSTVFISGIVCIAGAIIFALQLPALRKQIHPIYVKLGIIPEISSGIQTASQLARPPAE